jgi:tetratricopeptide (TPR) repeat protein
MVFNQAVQTDPDNLLYRRELAYTYFLLSDLYRAEVMIAPLLKDERADEETFQIACKIFAAKKNAEEAENAINKGIKKFPHAGILYCEKGELYTQQKKYKSASKAWEEGVKMAPGFHLNYYNLTKVYAFTKRHLWAIIYGETFVNLESFSSRTQEVKKIVFESYKFLMAELNNIALDGKTNRYDDPKDFESACMKIYDGLRNVVTGGIHTDNLIMLRTRFLLEWNKYYALQYPSELIDFQHRMIQKGHYDCYNQWLFGKLDNEIQFKNWTQKFSTSMNAFDQYLRNQKLQPKENQYYQTKS